MEYTSLLYDVRPNGVATITLNRPDVFNAFNDPLSYELQDALKQVTRDAAVRAVVLTGAGPRVTGLQQVRNQQPRQREMPKMIRPELPLKSVLRKFLGRKRHHSRVVDQDVERPGKPLRKASNRCQRSHIQIDDLGLRARNRRL